MIYILKNNQFRDGSRSNRVERERGGKMDEYIGEMRVRMGRIAGSKRLVLQWQKQTEEQKWPYWHGLSISLDDIEKSLMIGFNFDGYVFSTGSLGVQAKNLR